MNQFVSFNFTEIINNKTHLYSVQPGTPWEEVYSALEQFKEIFKKMEIEAKEREEKEKETKVS